MRAHLEALRGVEIAGPGKAALSYRVRIDGRDYYAVCLVKSSAYWYHRLHLAAPGVSLVVCMRHDTVLSIDVLELRTGRHYKPFEEPLQKPATRNNRYASLIVVRQLLAGDDSAWQRLKEYPESTRYRYLAHWPLFSLAGLSPCSEKTRSFTRTQCLGTYLPREKHFDLL